VIKKSSNSREASALRTVIIEKMRLCFVFLLFAGLLLAQATATPPRPVGFEVASIKPSAPLNPREVMMGQKRVGMKVDAVRADIANLSLADLVRIAYRVKPYQVMGPDWMKRDRFDIVGKLPEGGSQDQVPEMLQALLAQRFKLALHRETKEHAVYALVVGKNGPKLVEAPADAEPTSESAAPTTPDRGSSTVQLSADASSLLVSGERTGQIRISQGAGGMRLEARAATMAALADMLSRILDRPVVDMTALKGTYRLTLNLSMQDMHAMVEASGMMPPGPGMGGGDMHGGGADVPRDTHGSDATGNSVFQNIQQLGLKLDARRAPMEMIVIDHLEKAPTDN
jgi:uncharacterized protein (TIGR03435 family)